MVADAYVAYRAALERIKTNSLSTEISDGEGPVSADEVKSALAATAEIAGLEALPDDVAAVAVSAPLRFI